jgi:hypothetical protein
MHLCSVAYVIHSLPISVFLILSFEMYSDSQHKLPYIQASNNMTIITIIILLKYHFNYLPKMMVVSSTSKFILLIPFIFGSVCNRLETFLMILMLSLTMVNGPELMGL